MAKQSRCRRVARSTPEPPVAAVPATPEPPVRRWPHPVEGVEPIQDLDPALHYIRCALSYQNQLLADIKTLLQQLVRRRPGKMRRVLKNGVPRSGTHFSSCVFPLPVL